MKINRLFFTQGVLGQQIDLKKYSKPYWQPMKRTKQWNTASKWRRLCHQAGQLILYTLKPCEVNVSNTRSIRNVLNVPIALCPGRLDDSSLHTLFYEAMAIVNARPLTVSDINYPTAMEPLAANHILTMKPTIRLSPPGKFIKEDMYLRKHWRRVQYLTEQFWSRWKQEYVRNIAQRQKWRYSLLEHRVGRYRAHCGPRHGT